MTIEKTKIKNNGTKSFRVRMFYEGKLYSETFPIPVYYTGKKEEAYKMSVAQRYEDDIKKPVSVPTFRKYSTAFLEKKHKLGEIEATTANRYWQILDDINAEFGNKKLYEVKVSGVKKYLEHLRCEIFNHKTGGEGYAPKTVNEYRAIICMVMEEAYTDELIEDFDCKRIKKYKVTREKAKFYSLEQVENVKKIYNDNELSLKNSFYLHYSLRQALEGAR